MYKIIVLCFFLFCSCSSMFPEATIFMDESTNDTVFIYSYPKLKMEIDKEFKYYVPKNGNFRRLGPYKYPCYSYYFIKKDGVNKIIKEIIAIDIITANTYWSFGSSFDYSNCVRGEYRKLGGNRYHICGELPGENLNLIGLPFNKDAAVVYRRIAGQNNRILIEIKYSKDIADIDLSKESWKNHENILKKEYEELFSEDFRSFKIIQK